MFHPYDIQSDHDKDKDISLLLQETENPEDISFHLGSSYINASVTRGKEIVKESVSVEKEFLPNPFMDLDIIRSKGSSGKCWVFQKIVEGVFKGYLVPGGFRIMGMKQKTSSLG